jgi:succinate dehydrogenase / fumarate reductase iron-sulfur subunit
MRKFRDGDSIYIEPFRARAFPVIKDLVVDRAALDQVIQSGGYVSVGTGAPVDANTILIPKDDADYAMDAAECIGCGACVAACPNGSAMLFVGAKVASLARLPQGRPEAATRVCTMTETMREKGFGNCSNHYECEAACPKGISVKFIAKLNREYVKSLKD